MSDFEEEFTSYDFSWKNSAPCRGMDTSEFFPERVNKFNILKIRNIYTMCEKCNLRLECFYEAMQLEHDGIWAGTSAKERMGYARHLGKKNTSQVTLEECTEFISVYTNRYDSIESGEQ
jgi:hypothetical protein